jgi:hypothetical protein
LAILTIKTYIFTWEIDGTNLNLLIAIQGDNMVEPKLVIDNFKKLGKNVNVACATE